MIRLIVLGLICLSGVRAVEKPNRLSTAEAKTGWKLLFDGSSMTGWDVYREGDWVVKEGALVCQGTKPSWIGTKETFADYTLELEFRGSASVNSGVFLRSGKEGEPHLTGYELQIWDHQPAGFNTGSLVGSVKALLPTKVIPNEWNQYKIEAKGDHFAITLNGKVVLNAHDSKHASGVVGFQCQKENPIEFRSIKILKK